jgi:hypothetical protein
MTIRDRNYEMAETQVAQRIEEVTLALAEATVALHERRPGEAATFLKRAMDSIDGALTTARWATTLPEPEES